MKATVVADWRAARYGPTPCRLDVCTSHGPNEGIAVCFRHFPDVEALLDDGYVGLSRDHCGQAITPPRNRVREHCPAESSSGKRDRHGHSSDRIPVEHARADHKRWKQVTRWTRPAHGPQAADSRADLCAPDPPLHTASGDQFAELARAQRPANGTVQENSDAVITPHDKSIPSVTSRDGTTLRDDARTGPWSDRSLYPWQTARRPTGRWSHAA